MNHRLNWSEFLLDSAHSLETGCSIVEHGEVCWRVFFDKGKVVYADHSIASFSRFEERLRRLGYETAATASQSLARQSFGQLPQVYGAIAHLIARGHLQPQQTQTLIEDIAIEAIETLLCLPSATYRVEPISLTLLNEGLPLLSVIGHCEQRLRIWQKFAPEIDSPDLRLYLFDRAALARTPELSQMTPLFLDRLAQILKGLSFRQLAVLLKQDELKIARLLYTAIVKGAIYLRDPKPPFDRLPRIPHSQPSYNGQTPPSFEGVLPQVEATAKPTGYKIVCIDDSPTILQEINRFLSDERFSVFKITDPVKALVPIFRLEPDLILLDIGMPEINGYKLCSLLRNNPNFARIPIVMVTGNKGIIDRARARMVGATDYLTKPFTREGLLEIVGKYLELAPAPAPNSNLLSPTYDR